MHRLAAMVVGSSFVEGAAFRRAGEARLRHSGPGALLTLVELVLQRRGSRFPKYPYVVLTHHDLYVLDFRSTTGDARPNVFGRWPWNTVRIIQADPERRSTVIALPSAKSLLVLKGVFGSEAERHVLARLGDIARVGPTGGSPGSET